MVIVAYWMKGEGKQFKRFETLAEAQAFMSALAENPNCEAFGIEKERS